MTLTPILFVNRFHSRREGNLDQSIGAPPPPHDSAVTTARTGTSLARLNSEWTHRFGPQARVDGAPASASRARR